MSTSLAVLLPDSVWVDATLIKVPKRNDNPDVDWPEHIAYFLEHDTWPPSVEKDEIESLLPKVSSF
jgi:hypothetical protein